jgi:hypothetical protein
MSMTEERQIREGALQAKTDPSSKPPGQVGGTPTNPLTGRPVATPAVSPSPSGQSSE